MTDGRSADAIRAAVLDPVALALGAKPTDDDPPTVAYNDAEGRTRDEVLALFDTAIAGLEGATR